MFLAQLRAAALAIVVLGIASPVVAQTVHYQVRPWPTPQTSDFPLTTAAGVAKWNSLPPAPMPQGLDMCVSDASDFDPAPYLQQFVATVQPNGDTVFTSPQTAMHADAVFRVLTTTVGTWSFRAGGDWGNGAVLLLDGQVLQERWPAFAGSPDTDMWWNFGFTDPSQFLQGSAALAAGRHRIEVLGFDQCCSGNAQMQFLAPGSSTWQVIAPVALPLVACGSSIVLPGGPAGPAGPTGPTGPVGPTGFVGASGPQGAPGAVGPAGPMGPQGPQGIAGPAGPQGPGLVYRGAFSAAVAYAANDVVTSNGGSYVAGANAAGDPTQPDAVGWNALALPGDRGAQGEAGAIGPLGAIGPPGDPGARGPAGLQGVAGAAGAIGPQGMAGSIGAAGAAGQNGAAGTTGPQGAQGTAGATGAVGPQGPDGAIGPQGPPGPPGVNGTNGVNGANGLAGPTGPKGALATGLDFEIRRIQTDQTLTMAAGTSSVVYLVTTPPSNVNLTLPPALNATGRFVVIQRVDNGRLVKVRSQNDELIDGTRGAIVMDDKYDAVTLTSDGNEWVILVRR